MILIKIISVRHDILSIPIKKLKTLDKPAFML